MKKTLLILCACICALTACTEQKPAPTRAERIREQLLTCDESSVIVVAHRADWRNFPENSLEAIQSAIEMGVDMLEIDVQRTKDGVLILMHDHNLDRTTTGSGNIADTNWEDIAKLNLKDHQGNVTTYKVPKLEDALLMCKDRIMINLDKADRYFDEVFAMLERTGTTNLIVMKGGQPASEVKEKFGKYLENMVLVGRCQAILVAVLHKLLARIDKENHVVRTGTLAKHNDAGGDAYAKEEVGRKLDNGVHMVVFHQPTADTLLLASAIEHTGELYNSGRTAFAQ